MLSDGFFCIRKTKTDCRKTNQGQTSPVLLQTVRWDAVCSDSSVDMLTGTILSSAVIVIIFPHALPLICCSMCSVWYHCSGTIPLLSFHFFGIPVSSPSISDASVPIWSLLCLPFTQAPFRTILSYFWIYGKLWGIGWRIKSISPS